MQAINVYYQSRLEKGPAPLVVCCRSKEYMALPTRVKLHQAVSIQPLTSDQIERYFQGTKGQFEVLHQVLFFSTSACASASGIWGPFPGNLVDFLDKE